MNAFRLIHLRRFFQHKGRTALSLAGISIGAALVVAVLGLFGSLDGSVDAFVRDLSGTADLEVLAVADDGFAESLYFTIAETEGVEAAVPMIRSSVLVRGHRALLVGFDQRAEALEGNLPEDQVAELQRKTVRPGVFLGDGLARNIGAKEGESVDVFGGGTRSEHEVLAVLEDESARFNQGIFIGTSLPLAQAMLGRQGKLDAVFVIVADGFEGEDVASRLSVAVSGAAAVEDPAQRGAQARRATRDMRSGMLIGTIMALIVGAFLIFNTMNMAATERRRELATLRALGGKRRRLLVMFLGESALLGLMGSAVGAALGYVLARGLVASIPPFFVSAIGVELGFMLPRYALPAAIGAGTGASLLAAYLPARRAVSVPPVESMRPEGVLESLDGADRLFPVPTAVGGALLIAGGVLSVRGPGDLGFAWVSILIAGILILSYGLTAPITWATAAVATPLGVGGRLAASAVARAPRRAWATSAAVVVATGMVVAQNGIFANLTDSVNAVVSSLSKIDLYVSASDGASFADVRLPGDWSEEIASIPGVAHVGINYFAFIQYEGQKVLLQGIEGSVGEAPALARATPEQIVALDQGKAAIVSERFEELYGVGPGDSLVLPTPSGNKTFEVIDAVPQFTWEGGHVTIGRQPIIDYFRDSTVTDYMVIYEADADPAEVRAAIDGFVQSSPIPVHLITGDEQVRIIHGTVDQVSSLFSAMTLVVVGAATLAIFNALLISVVERKRELGIMRAIGTSRRQLRRMVAIEAGALGAVGGIIGLIMGFVLHRASMGAVVATSGFPLQYELHLTAAILPFVIGVTIAVLGSLLPARRASTVNIIEAIGYE